MATMYAHRGGNHDIGMHGARGPHTPRSGKNLPPLETSKDRVRAPVSPRHRMGHGRDDHDQLMASAASYGSLEGDDRDSSGFEVMQAVLRKVVARMTNDISLNEKWLALSTYLDGYYYDTDTATLAQQCHAVLNQAEKDTANLPKPAQPMTAAGCLVLDRLINWVGHRHPPLLSVFRCIRHIIYESTFLDKTDMSFQDPLLDGDLLAPEVLPLAMSVYSEPTYYDELRYNQGLRAAYGPPQEMQKKYDEINNRLSYYRREQLRTLFSSWKSSTVKEKQTQAAFAELQQQLADVTSWHEKRTAEIRERCGRIERENEALKTTISDLKRQLMEGRPADPRSPTPNSPTPVAAPMAASGSPLKGAGPLSFDSESMADLLDMPSDGRILVQFFNNLVSQAQGNTELYQIEEFTGGMAMLDKLAVMLGVLMPESMTQDMVKDVMSSAGPDGKLKIIGYTFDSVGMGDSMNLLQTSLKPDEDGGSYVELVVAHLFMWYTQNIPSMQYPGMRARWSQVALERLTAATMTTMLREGVSRKVVFGTQEGDYSKLQERLTQDVLADVLPAAENVAESALAFITEKVQANGRRLAGVFTLYAHNKAWTSTMNSRSFHKFCTNSGLFDEADPTSQDKCQQLYTAVTSKSPQHIPQPPAAAAAGVAAKRPTPQPPAAGRAGYRSRLQAGDGEAAVMGQQVKDKEEMGPAEWMEALIRAAAARTEAAFEAKVEEVLKLVCGHIRALEAAEFRVELADWRVQRVLRNNRKRLIKLFRQYSADKIKVKGRDMAVMSGPSFQKLLHDTRCLNSSFTADDAMEIFQFNRSDNNSDATDLEYFGFVEWMDAMATVSVCKNPSPYLPMWQRIETFLDQLLGIHVPDSA